MKLWNGNAVRDRFGDTGRFVAGPYRIVLHSTEGSSYAGARGAYVANGVSPHFTISHEKGHVEVWQHVALDRAATALEHPAGSGHTNRQSAIQIEVVAFASKPNWPEGLMVGVRDLIVWITDQVSVAMVAPEFKAYPASFGPGNGVRFSEAAWSAFNGVCGHQHVPGQSHGDPGNIDIARLLTVPVPDVPRPPTISHTDFPGGEDMLTRHDVDIPALDHDGRGWVELDVPADTIVSIVVNGPYPPSDGYWELPVVARQARDGKTIVAITEGAPSEHLRLSVWSAT